MLIKIPSILYAFVREAFLHTLGMHGCFGAGGLGCWLLHVGRACRPVGPTSAPACRPAGL